MGRKLKAVIGPLAVLSPFTMFFYDGHMDLKLLFYFISIFILFGLQLKQRAHYSNWQYPPELGDYGPHSGGPPSHDQSVTMSAHMRLFKLFAVFAQAECC